MSIKVMTRIWEHSEHKGGALLLLLALADYADDNGICWPDVSSVARKARMSDRQATTVIHQLEKDGAIEYHQGGGRGKRSSYVILVGLAETDKERVKEFHRNNFSEIKTLKSAQKKGEVSSTKRVKFSVISRTDSAQQDAPNPDPIRHIEPSLETSGVNARANAPRAPRKKTEKQPTKETTPIAIIKALATACQIDRDLATKETHIILANAAERLYKAGKGKDQTDEQIAETIRYVGSYFMKNDWRGKKGEPPTPGQLLDTWKRAIDARQTAAPETKYYQSQAHKYLQGDELRAAFDEATRKRARIRSVGEA